MTVTSGSRQHFLAGQRASDPRETITKAELINVQAHSLGVNLIVPNIRIIRLALRILNFILNSGVTY